MGLLDKQKNERLKYINAITFINLIAFTTKEIVQDIVSYLINENFEQKVTSYYIDTYTRISRDDHRENFGFDVNTRKFLDNCYSNGFFDDYVYYGSVNKLEGDFYYLIEDLQSLDFINELSLNFESLNKVSKVVSNWYLDSLDPIYRHFKSDFDNPTHYQSKLIKQDAFSVVDAACLLSGTSPEDIEKYKNHSKFTELYTDYISYKLMFELALTNNEIEYKFGYIQSIDLQEYLFKTGYIIKGFNDWLTIEPAKALVNNNSNKQLETSNIELKNAKEKIAELEIELADKPADSITHSNTDIQNIKKAAIRQFNRSLAMALIELDYQSNLRKGDIVDFIIPHMKKLAFVLADEQLDKAKVLTVKSKTIYDTHLQGLEFKQGTQTTKERERVNIDLLFKKQLPVTE